MGLVERRATPGFPHGLFFPRNAELPLRTLCTAPPASCRQSRWYATPSAWRMRVGGSREAVAAHIVARHETLGLDRSGDVHFDPPARTDAERLRLNTERIFRWLDDDSKGGDLLPLNSLPAVLAALTLDLRLRLADALLAAAGLRVEALGSGDGVLGPGRLLQRVVRENAEAAATMAEVVGRSGGRAGGVMCIAQEHRHHAGCGGCAGGAFGGAASPAIATAGASVFLSARCRLTARRTSSARRAKPWGARSSGRAGPGRRTGRPWRPPRRSLRAARRRARAGPRRPARP